MEAEAGEGPRRALDAGVSARRDSETTAFITTAIPVFGYKSHASIDRRDGFIRRWEVTDAAAHDGRMLRRGLLDKSNTGPTVWADSAYRSRANETFIERHGFKSQLNHRKPRGRPMPPHIRRGNASRSKIRAGIEHVFAHQKGPMALCIRTIGIRPSRVSILTAPAESTCHFALIGKGLIEVLSSPAGGGSDC